MAEQYPRAAHPQRRRRLHVVALLHGQDLPPDHARVHDPAGRRQTDDDVAQPEADDGVDGEGQEDEGEGELDVGDAHEDRARPAAEETGQQPQESADERGEQHRAEADEERHARAVEHPREQVAPELVGAEEVARGARRLEARREVAPERVVGGEPRSGERNQHGQRGDQEPENAEPMAPELPDGHVALSRRVRGSSHP